MTDLNIIVMTGRLTKDAEVTYLNNNTPKAALSLAVNRSKKDGEKWANEVSYFDWVLFGKQAESLKKYLTKGKQLTLKGHAKQERWEKDGKKNSRVSFICDVENGLQLLGGSSDNSNSNNGFTASGNSAPVDNNGFTEDIPF